MKAKDLSVRVPGVYQALDFFMMLRASYISAFLSMSFAVPSVQTLSTSCLICHNSFLPSLTIIPFPLPVHLKYLLYVSSLYSVTL